MAKTVKNEAGRTIRSVEIAFSIIDVVQEQGGVGVTALAEELDHSKSTIHSHLRTLEEQEILVRDSEGYRLGLHVLDMATHVREQVGNYDVIRNEVDTLAEETAELAQFGLEEQGKVSCLYKSSGARGIESASRVGKKQPMYSTSLGKTILANLSDERVEEIVRSTEFETSTSNTITSQEELLEQLEQIRKRGYGIDDEENYEGLRCVAAPVKDEESVLGAVSITGPSSRITMGRIRDDLSNKVQRAANVIKLNTKFG